MVSAASFAGRIVHHALVGVLDPLIECRFVSDSYARCVGRGTHRAVRRVHGYLRTRRYIFQAAPRTSFPRVGHEVDHRERTWGRHLRDTVRPCPPVPPQGCRRRAGMLLVPLLPPPGGREKDGARERGRAGVRMRRSAGQPIRTGLMPFIPHISASRLPPSFSITRQRVAV